MTMNNKTAWAVTIAAILSVAAITSVTAADALGTFLFIEEAEVELNDSKIKEVEIETDSKIAKDGDDGAFGYGILDTTGSFALVATTHRGVFDSNVQDGPAGTTVAICTPEQLDDGLCGPEWHTHYVELGTDGVCVDNTVDMDVTKNPDGLYVSRITFEEPSEKIKVKKDEIKIKDVQKYGTFTNSLNGTTQSFAFGDYDGLMVSFALDVRGGNVCVDFVQPVILPEKTVEFKLDN